MVLIVTGMVFAAGDAPRACVNKIPDGVPAVDEESFNVAVATTPFKILLVFIPSRTHVCDPDTLLHVTDFDAAVACVPGARTTWVTLAVG